MTTMKPDNVVFVRGGYDFIKLPGDAARLVEEGTIMQHCLGDPATAEAYAERIRDGSQELYSMVDILTDQPVVDIEVSITRSSYSGPVDRPTVTQIRGKRNECPPAPSYLLPLLEFFQENPKWALSGHGVPNFDGRVDGDLLVRSVEQYCGLKDTHTEFLDRTEEEIAYELECDREEVLGISRWMTPEQIARYRCQRNFGTVNARDTEHLCRQLNEMSEDINRLRSSVNMSHGVGLENGMTWFGLGRDL